MRKKQDKHLTLLLIPDGADKSRQFHISQKILKIFLVFFVLLLFLSFSLIGYIVIKNITLTRNNKFLLTENTKLNQEKNVLLAVNQQVEQMQEDMIELQILEKQLEEKINESSPEDSLSQFPPADIEHRGIGGNQSITPLVSFASDEDQSDVDQVSTTCQFISENLPLQLYQTRVLLKQYNDYQDEMARIPSIYPTMGSFTSGFGFREDPFTHQSRFHEGIDIANSAGTPIYCTAKGRVVFTGNISGFGQTIKIEHSCSLVTLYAHLSAIHVSTGDEVCKGQFIGEMGSTGRSTDPHLHYGVYINDDPVNPARFLPLERSN